MSGIVGKQVDFPDNQTRFIPLGAEDYRIYDQQTEPTSQRVGDMWRQRRNSDGLVLETWTWTAANYWLSTHSYYSQSPNVTITAADTAGRFALCPIPFGALVFEARLKVQRQSNPMNNATLDTYNAFVKHASLVGNLLDNQLNINAGPVSGPSATFTQGGANFNLELNFAFEAFPETLVAGGRANVAFQLIPNLSPGNALFFFTILFKKWRPTDYV